MTAIIILINIGICRKGISLLLVEGKRLCLDPWLHFVEIHQPAIIWEALKKVSVELFVSAEGAWQHKKTWKQRFVK